MLSLQYVMNSATPDKKTMLFNKGKIICWSSFIIQGSCLVSQFLMFTKFSDMEDRNIPVPHVHDKLIFFFAGVISFLLLLYF